MKKNWFRYVLPNCLYSFAIFVLKNVHQCASSTPWFKSLPPCNILMTVSNHFSGCKFFFCAPLIQQPTTQKRDEIEVIMWKFFWRNHMHAKNCHFFFANLPEEVKSRRVSSNFLILSSLIIFMCLWNYLNKIPQMIKRN